MINLEFKALTKEEPSSDHDILVAHIYVGGSRTVFHYNKDKHDGLRFIKAYDDKNDYDWASRTCWSYFDFDENKHLFSKFSDEMPDTIRIATPLIIYTSKKGKVIWGRVGDEWFIKHILIDPSLVNKKASEDEEEKGIKTVGLDKSRLYWSNFRFVIPVDDMKV